MVTKLNRNTLPFFLLCLVIAVASFKVNAAPVAIDSMFVDNASFTITTTTLGSDSASATLPSVEITMGSYQPSIFQANSYPLAVNVFTAGPNPAPSGYVDGSTINVDLSSLMASVTYYGTDLGPVGLWPLNTTLDYGTYDPANGNYLIGWTETVTIDISGLVTYSDTASLDVNLSGYLTTVPLPAALWLFGSGIVALFGFANSKRKLYKNI